MKYEEMDTLGQALLHAIKENKITGIVLLEDDEKNGIFVNHNRIEDTLMMLLSLTKMFIENEFKRPDLIKKLASAYLLDVSLIRHYDVELND